MKSPVIYLAIGAVAIVLLTFYLIHKQSLADQIEELNERSRREKFLMKSSPEMTQLGYNGESFLRSLDPAPPFELVDRISLKLHAAAAQEFFKIAGIFVDQMSPDYFYELDSTSAEWITLIGESGDGKNATLVVAAKANSNEQLVQLIEKRWKLTKEQWKRLENIKVRDCAQCEAYHFKYKKEDYVLILGKGENSDLVHAVAELSQPSRLQSHAQQLADRLSFKKSEGF